MNEYDKQAQDFLDATGTKFEIVYQYTGKYFEGDTESRDIYRFTLSNSRFTYSSTFGDSIFNTERRLMALNIFSFSSKPYGKARRDLIKHGLYSQSLDRFNYKLIKECRSIKPRAYDVLAGLESYFPESFEDFCEEYGYSEFPIGEHHKIYGVYLKCLEQYKAVKNLFTEEQRELLAEIN